MKIRIKSDIKSRNGLKEYTKEMLTDVKAFFYDEDVFWFDYQGKRFGIDFNEMIKLRNQVLEDLEECKEKGCGKKFIQNDVETWTCGERLYGSRGEWCGRKLCPECKEKEIKE